MAEAAGADGITAHLREDRRHIRDADIAAIMDAITIPLNFEMAATEEMQGIALSHGPHAACIVPERREERTTEGGLEVAGDQNRLARFIGPLSDAGMRVSLFIAADPEQIAAAARIGAPVVELHTGAYCDHFEGNFEARDAELARLIDGPKQAADLGSRSMLGHGLTYDTVRPIAACPGGRAQYRPFPDGRGAVRRPSAGDRDHALRDGFRPRLTAFDPRPAVPLPLPQVIGKGRAIISDPDPELLMRLISKTAPDLSGRGRLQRRCRR
jgi:pyridoxine 5-phosphate synthase